MLRPWLRAVVSIAVVAALFTVVPVAQVWAAVRGINVWVWMASVAIFVAGHTVNALKLRLLLGPGAATVSSCVRAHFAGIAANLGLPGVAGGDIVRASYLAARGRIARVAVAAIADRIVDLSVLAAITLVAARVAGLPQVGDGSASRRRWLIVAIVLVVVVSVILFSRWRLKRANAQASVREALAHTLARPWALAGAAFISLSVQSVFVLTNVWLASEVGVRIALAPWFLAWTASKLTVVLPISLGGLGVREATLVTVLAAYGAPADRVLATGVLWQGAIIAGSTSGFVATQMLRKR
jgi:uncharacterized membrane protein YbhN (UPF0104 family)